MDEEKPEVLDDLRKKRLAYFQTREADASAKDGLDKDEQNPHRSLGKANVSIPPDPRQHSTEKPIPDNSRPERMANAFLENDKAGMSKTPTENPSKRHEFDSNENTKSMTSATPSSFKTSSFFLPSPNKTEEYAANKVSDTQQSDAKNVTNYKSTHKSSELGRGTEESKPLQEGDGYNETVERLIRATKEELLGMKSTDNIWANIRTSIPASEGRKDEQNLSTSEQVKNKVVDSQQRRDNASLQQRRSNSESESHEHLSASLSNFREPQHLNKPKLFSQTSVPAGVKYQTFEMYPAPSSKEPLHTKHEIVNMDTQKSLNSKTVEQIFSSRQVARSVVVPQYNVIGSQDLETNVPPLLNNQQSVDFADLGLSTHRPESDGKEDAIKVEADDINLGDTVTQELRTLLGEEKFKQFLIKSKQDIDDLHQDKMSDVSDGSARRDKTPRLLKDRPTLPKKPNTPTSDRKPMKPKAERIYKKNGGPNPPSGNNVAKDSSKVKASRENKDSSSRKSQDFTPRDADGDAVNNLIGKYVLNQSESEKQFTSNPALKTKHKLQELKNEQQSPSPKPVPDLNLEVLENDSPRPKLHRPKHEPPTIYSEKTRTDLSDRESFNNSSDGKQSPARNYEQVTVPRNVAFSANEIYHQAYGMYYMGQPTVAPMSPSVPSHIQSKPHPGTTYGVPLTPKTPTGSTPFTEPSGYNQYYHGPKPQGQASYPPVSGMTYQGMPLTPVTPHDVSPQMYGVQDAANAGQFIPNMQQQPAGGENVQAPTSQPAPPPYMYAPYNQMYGMMPDMSGGYPAAMAPPQPVRMVHPSGIAPPTGMPHSVMSPSVAVASPRFPAPVMSGDQSMHIPHPPASVATSHQLNQSAVSALTSSSSQGVPMAYPYSYPVMMVTPHPPGDQPFAPPPVQPQIPETPQTSHVEVQTETEERDMTPEPADDKGTLVEESTFTSVSQIKVNDEVMMPHPPATKKGSRSSPRKPPKVSQTRSVQKNQRHIEGIRQHHEQRRQKQEEEQMSEEKIVEKQKKFAKQSLERYFSSLENLYVPSSKLSTSSAEAMEGQHFQPDAASEVLSEEIEEFVPETETYERIPEIIPEMEDYSKRIHEMVPEIEDYKERFPENVPEMKDYSKRIYKMVPEIEEYKEMIPENVPQMEDYTKRIPEFIPETEDYSKRINEMVPERGDFKKRIPEFIPETDVYKERPHAIDVAKYDDGIVEDVLSEVNTADDHGNFNKIVPGFMDFREFDKHQVLPKEALNLHLKNNVREVDREMKENRISPDDDSQTLITSARTGVSIKAGGLTERLNEIGVEAHSSNENDKDNDSKDLHEGSEILGKKSDEKKGKVLIVCPDCKGLNKKYMSWCTHCGEIIIGVEPMLVSKNKQGKIRMKPLTKVDVDEEKPIDKEIHISVKDDSESKKDLEQEDEEDVPEKPFSLNLDVIKSPLKDTSEVHNASPSKSDGKDSGRPSSEDNDLQNYKIEQEVVNDICETITDPILKGYLRSHFAKKGHAVLDKSHGKAKFIGSLLSTSEEKETVDDIVVERVDDDRLRGDQSVNLPEYQTAKEEMFVSKKFDKNTQPEPAISDIGVSKSFHQEVVNVQPLDLTQHMKMHEMQLDDFSADKSANNEEENFLEPPPIPSFSAAVPKQSGVDVNELRLKLPANSMDFSEDFSQAESINFDKASVEEKLKAEKKRKEREERRQARRKSRGHGAIDVEVFGYEESRESRNSSRGLKLVPILNLCGNSSDEDDMSIQSEATDTKLNPDVGYQPPGNAWEPIPESPEVRLQLSQVKQEVPEVKQEVPQVTQEVPAMGPAGDMSNTRDMGMYNAREDPKLKQAFVQEMHEKLGISSSGHDVSAGAQQLDSNDNWKQLLSPDTPEIDDIPDDPDDTDIPELDQPFLAQVISKSLPKKSKRRPISARSKPVKSKVRKSIEEPGYQRKWARSSTAWSSFNQGELNTSASVQSSCDSSRIRPASAPKARNLDSSRTRPSSAPKARNLDNRKETASPSRAITGKQARPQSADLYKRKQVKQKKPKGITDLDLDPVEDMVEHRLPRPGLLDMLQEKQEEAVRPERMESPNSTYEKYLQMTPRIEAGTLSRWQCLPDEIWLYIFSYLNQASLTRCAQVCHQFYRVAMDETLWKYITLKKKAQLDDQCLLEVSKRHPVSLALIQCHGDNVTARGLRDLFRECADSLKELNVGWCSRGALNGDSILLHAAARCHNITHIDTSWCNVTDSGLMAISNCCNRLESLCISGCQAISNDGIETVIKKHGPHLRVLEMFGCFNIGPRGLRCISNNCINLISVNLGQCYKLTDSCVAQLSSSLGRVETLDLRGLKQIRDNCIRRVVKNCTRLKHLSLANCPNISDVSVLEIATYLTDIRSVDLCGCKNITDNSIRALVNTCSNLRHIDISSTGCTHRSVSMIANFCGQRLESLKINFLSDVTEQSLIKLAKHCLRLSSVHMYGCTSIRNTDKIQQERPSFTLEM